MNFISPTMPFSLQYYIVFHHTTKTFEPLPIQNIKLKEVFLCPCMTIPNTNDAMSHETLVFHNVQFTQMKMIIRCTACTSSLVYQERLRKKYIFLVIYHVLYVEHHSQSQTLNNYDHVQEQIYKVQLRIIHLVSSQSARFTGYYIDIILS